MGLGCGVRNGGQASLNPGGGGRPQVVVGPVQDAKALALPPLPGGLRGADRHLAHGQRVPGAVQGGLVMNRGSLQRELGTPMNNGQSFFPDSRHRGGLKFDLLGSRPNPQSSSRNENTADGLAKIKRKRRSTPNLPAFMNQKKFHSLRRLSL